MVKIPSQDVTFPLHDPSAWHVRFSGPFIINPSSQLKLTSLGNVVWPPDMDPFLGVKRGPQSLARIVKKHIVVISFRVLSLQLVHQFHPN